MGLAGAGVGWHGGCEGGCAIATTESRTDVLSVVQELGPCFAARAAEHDATDRFVAENYADLKARRVF